MRAAEEGFVAGCAEDLGFFLFLEAVWVCIGFWYVLYVRVLVARVIV